jgi:hypothetical protein
MSSIAATTFFKETEWLLNEHSNNKKYLQKMFLASANYDDVSTTVHKLRPPHALGYHPANHS